GGMLLVTSVDDYANVINRVFSRLLIKRDVRELLAGEAPVTTLHHVRDRKASLNEELTALFQYRHWLVHEIDIGTIGPYSLREALSLENVQQHAQNVLHAIRLVERHFTEQAPEDFPNLLDKDGNANSELDSLRRKITTVENEISSRLQGEPEEEAWKTAVT